MNESLDISRTFPLTFFFSGIIFTSFGFAGIFFLKFWKKTKERFFLAFALACWALSIERIAMLIESKNNETSAWVYLFRLVAFFLVFLAVYHANQQKRE